MNSSTKPKWLKEWEEKEGRTLRVLHIGNIANNAYLNAKLMRRVGIHADVLCYDYHHVMGTPEWEDASYSGKLGDSFYPDWWRVNLNGFVRPTWFYQGPKPFAWASIRSQFEDDAALRRKGLLAEYLTHYLCYKNADTSSLTVASSRLRSASFWVFTTRYMVTHPRTLFAAIEHKSQANRAAAIIVKTLSFFGHAAGGLASIAAASALPAIIIGKRRAEKNSEKGDRGRAVLNYRWHQLTSSYERLLLEPGIRFGSRAFRRVAGRSFSDVFGKTFREATNMTHDSSPMEESVDEIEISDILSLNAAEREAYQNALIQAVILANETLHQQQGWYRDHCERFSDTSATELASDFKLARALAHQWHDVLRHYDVVQCYATDGIIPMTLNIPYSSYEHGTLRDIPFAPTSIGRLTASAYRNASVVLVTNLDNLPRCDDLEIPGERVVPLPHALDDSKLYSFQASYEPESEEVPLFFSPSRQDWQDGDLNYAKGNDIFIRAAARLAESGADFRILFVEWGRDVAASKRLIEELGLKEKVRWVAPLQKSELWGQLLSCHAVVDQFVIPAFGSVTFESLILGKRVITNLDIPLATRFFGEPPPIMVSYDIDTAYHAMLAVAQDPEDLAGIGDSCGRWAETYHSSARVLELQLREYSGLAGYISGTDSDLQSKSEGNGV